MEGSAPKVGVQELTTLEAEDLLGSRVFSTAPEQGTVDTE
jgi:hypothetical protein